MCSVEASPFSPAKRLGQVDVLAVLKSGKRLKRVFFELRFLLAPLVGARNDGKLAISVPKKMLRSSVARNRIKRLVREAFRHHLAASAPLHMLVIYKAGNDGRCGADRRSLRRELAGLFDDAAVRVRAAENRAN